MIPSAREHRIGRYRVVRPIGIGGMAEALLCELPSEAGLHRRVVVKRLLPHLRAETEVVRMLMDEARITLPLHHSNIASALELGRDGEDYYLVTEYVDGVDLGTLLAHAGRMSPVTALTVAADVLEGLAYAHEARDESGNSLQIVHRDVSPANILLSRAGDVRLGDFGVARARHRLRKTIDGVVRGTLAHMSPEQAAGDDVDARSDVYSMGTVLWRMLSGREIPGLTRGYGAPPLAPIGMGEALDRVLAGALGVRREDRFATASEMLAAVRAALAESGPEVDGRAEVAALVVGVPAPAESAPRPPRRATGPTLVLLSDRPSSRRWKPAALGLGSAALGLGLLVLLGPSVPPRASPEAPPIGRSSTVSEGLPVTPAVASIAPADPSSAPAPAPAPAPNVGRTPSPERGTLDLFSSPWAYVEVDGTRLGPTPLRGVRVAAGPHRVRFVNPDLGRSKEVRVDARSSTVTRVSVDLEAP